MKTDLLRRKMCVGMICSAIGLVCLARPAFSEFFVIGAGGGNAVRRVGPQEMTGNSTSPVLSVAQSGTGHGLQVTTDATGVGKAAVHGEAGKSGITMNSYAGVQGESLNGRGVVGISSANDGVMGYSPSGVGVHGQSLSGYGVRAYSRDNAALKADGYVEADSYRFSRAKTNYWSLSGNELRPRVITPNTYFVSAAGTPGAFFHVDHVGVDQLIAPLHLPHGATIRRFEASFYDNAAIDLRASILIHGRTSTYTTTSLGQIDSTGLAGYGTRGSNINYVVNNTNAFHEIYVRPVSGDWETAGNSLRIIGVTITYTTTEAQ